MNVLNIDIETFSSFDLKSCGVYKYVEAPDFEILLFAYSIDGGTVHIIDLASGEKLPVEINHALTDKNILKTAFNAQFERVCIARHFLKVLTADQWECSMVKGAMLGLPFSLEQVGKVLKLNTQKDSAGKALIKYFSMPCKPTASNGMRTRNSSIDDFEKWESFKAYCVRDVETEIAIRERINWFEIPEQEKKLWELDQRINDTGIALEPILIRHAIQINEDFTNNLKREAVSLTGLDNPNSVSQLKAWVEEQEGIEVDSLNKEALTTLQDLAINESVRRALSLREQLAKSSVKKYAAMENYICGDCRAHGLMQFYGANRTGRWAGRGIQIQNLPRIGIKDIEIARNLVYNCNTELLTMLYGSTPDVLSQLIRTAFRATTGNRLIVADFSAIEARVLSWLAGEKWRLEVFKTHGKIYEASAAAMFKVPIDSISKDSPLRQKGKIAELALGYGGSVGALEKMGALKMGIPWEELGPLVAMWRKANHKICTYWSTVEEAAINAVKQGKSEVGKGVSFKIEQNVLFVNLPSGRSICYLKPEILPGRFGNDALYYHGLDQTTKQWKLVDTFGGKLVENIVQAVSRDLLAEAMLRLDAAGYTIVAHVHDEVIIDQPKGFGSLEEVIKIMTEVPKWALGLPLAADGFESEYYKK